MFLSFAAWVAFFLGIHPFLYPHKSLWKKGVACTLGILYLLLFACLFSVPSFFCFLASLFFTGLLLFIFQKTKLSPLFSLGVLPLFLIGSLLQAYPAIDPTAQLLLTGKMQEKNIEWKPPFDSLQKQTLPTYEVRIANKTEISPAVYLLGEVVGLRYKTIRLHPVLRWIGCSDPICIEYLTTDYLTPTKIGVYPTQTVPIQGPKTGLRYGDWFFWENAFFRCGKLPFWAQSATLQTTYIPLIDEKGNARTANIFLDSILPP